MATTKKMTLANARKELKRLLGNHDYSPLREDPERTRPALLALVEQEGDAVCDALAEGGVLGIVGWQGDVEMVAKLLERGVDPNAPDKPSHGVPGATPLQAVTEGTPDDEVKNLVVVELLLKKGASVDALYPPPDVRVSTPRHGPLDNAVKSQRDRLLEKLLPYASEASRAHALVTAVLQAEGQPSDSRPRRFLAEWITKLPVDGAGPMGLSALHAAAIGGDEDVYALVEAHAKEKQPKLAEAVSFTSYSFPSGPGGGLIPSARFAAGSTPLDLIGPVRAVFVAGRGKFEAAKGGKGWGAFNESQLAKIVARIEALDALEAKLKAAGATSGATREALPGPLGVVEAALMRLAKAAGTEARLAAAIGGIDTTGMGPLGFLLQITSDAKDAFAPLERRGAHRLDLFLTGALRETPVLYGPKAKALRGTFLEPGEETVLIWPEEYPAEAKRIFETALLGLDGDTVIGATKEHDGTKLWAVDSESVTLLGEMTAFVAEGAAALLGEKVAAAPPSDTKSDVKPAAASPVKGKNVCITGKMSLDRDEVTRKLEALGANVTSGVSGKTQILFAGEKAGSKLAKAKEMGIPVLDEKGLAKVLAGETPPELGGASDAVSAPAKPIAATPAAVTPTATTPAAAPAPSTPATEPPMPSVTPRPRDGAFRAHHAGSTQVSAEGEYVGGKKHGVWRWWYSDGQLQSEVTFVHGLREGHETGWHENGNKSAEGDNRGGHREGPWDFWYASGAFQQRYLYRQGKQHGEYVWNLENGSPRARGQFCDGRRVGHWTWHGEPQHEKMTRGHDDLGRNHGEDAGWYPGGQLAYRRFYDHGKPVGVHEAWSTDGTLTSRTTYDASSRLVEKLTVVDGKETIERFVHGLPEKLVADRKKLTKLAAKVAKGKDRYKKQDALGEAVDYGQRGALALHLWREGVLDLPKEPELFELVRGEAHAMSGEELMRLLAQVELTKDTYSAHIPQWPSDLDELVVEVFARDPGPIEAGWRELPSAAKRGVGFVLARFGKDVRKELGDLSELLAKKHAESAIQERLRWPARPPEMPADPFRPDEVRLFDWQLPTPAFDDFLALYGSKERFAEKLLEIAKERVKNPLTTPIYFSTYKPAIERAAVEDLAALVRGGSLHQWTAAHTEAALLKWRSDGAEALTTVALAIDDHGLRKWPAVCCAIVKRAEEGLPVDERLVDALVLPAETPSLGWVEQRIGKLPLEDLKRDPAWIDSAVDFANDPELGTEPNFETMRIVYRALRVLPEATVKRLVERTLESQYGKTHAAPYLHLVNDPVLWERAIEVMEKEESVRMHQVALGLAHLPIAALPILEAAWKRATKKDVKASVHRAIVGVLARAASRGETWDPRWDELVQMEVEAASYDYPYVGALLRKVVHRLPTERAEKVLLRELDPKRPKSFARAMTLVASHPTEAVLRAAFRGLLVAEERIASEDQHPMGPAMSAIPDVAAWVKWLLKKGAGSKLAGVFESAVGGTDKYKALKASLESDGVETAKVLDKVDQLVALAKRELGASVGEPIYLLRRFDAPPKELAPLGLNRIGGLPPGVTADEWPTCGDEPMVHLFTLDLATMPELRQQLGGKRTFSFFMASPEMNEAYEPGNEQTAVVMLDDAQVGSEGEAPEDTVVRDTQYFEPVRVEVPSRVFFAGGGELYKAIYGAHARVLGDPIWLQSEEDGGGTFVMQLDEGFVDVNLGDMGVLYVYEDGGFWQCH
jgi:antitoxin component YwqK of YwqJK toxin-antitoxin module